MAKLMPLPHVCPHLPVAQELPLLRQVRPAPCLAPSTPATAPSHIFPFPFRCSSQSCCLERTPAGLLVLWPPGIPAKLGPPPTLLPPVTPRDLFGKGAMVAMDTRQKPSLGARNVEMGFFL